MTELLKPGLYSPEGTADAPAHPALIGGACTCGHVFFPMQAYGCEKCGSTAIAPRLLSGRGRLIASSRVHLHAGKGREAPFTVGSIVLDDGPMVRTLLADTPTSPVAGQRVHTVLVSVADASGSPRLDLRFAPDN